MKLLLRLFENETDTGLQRSLEQGRMTIGRGPENDWVLADPDRTISKGHCRIDSSEGGFLLTDTSTNGVFLGGHPQALGRGHSCALEDGDSFSLGPYRVAVQLAEEGAGTIAGRGAAPDGARSPIAGDRDDAWLSDIPLGGFGPDRRAAPEGWQAPPDPAAYAASGTLDPATSSRSASPHAVLRAARRRASRRRISPTAPSTSPPPPT